MNNIIELSADDILMVSGGGNSGDHDHCWNSVKNDAMHGAIASGYAGLIAGGISGIAGEFQVLSEEPQLVLYVGQ
ncbi:hypothetical protein [Enterobacter soli]|uniref:hypothetical protein n=1 Tax=Enterobacter soli TaxID=885040 RepID=UPI00059B35FA|nr:hypothetical protein [Enterobacter soli]